jgi:hypothetical protein
MFRSLIALSALSLPCLQGIGQLRQVSETIVSTPGGWQERVENLASSPIAALHATFRCPKGDEGPKFNSEIRFDSLVAYGTEKPIPPRSISDMPMQPWAIDCPGGVDAVIFANGQSDGDQDVLKQMYQMRSGVYDGLIFAEKSVDTIANAGADPRVVASDLRSQAGAVNKDPTLSEAKHRGETLALGVVATLLEGQHDLPVPSDKTPRHQETIEQVMKEKKISYQLAHAIVIGKKLREWSTALEGNLQPASAGDTDTPPTPKPNGQQN